jgi:hypothetical protein
MANNTDNRSRESKFGCELYIRVSSVSLSQFYLDLNMDVFLPVDGVFLFNSFKSASTEVNLY